MASFLIFECLKDMQCASALILWSSSGSASWLSPPPGPQNGKQRHESRTAAFTSWGRERRLRYANVSGTGSGASGHFPRLRAG